MWVKDVTPHLLIAVVPNIDKTEAESETVLTDELQ
jgi:hypothetical protein